MWLVGPVCDKGNIRIREGRCINEARHDTNGRTGSGERETDLGRRLLANMARMHLTKEFLRGSSSQCQAGLEVEAFI